MKIPVLLTFLSCSLAPTFALVKRDDFDPKGYNSGDVITRDVAVIGGGSSGTYSAINLRLLGRSVVVVEKEDTLGGHTHTFRDPGTGKTIEYGVVAFYNISAASDYFAHLNISVAALSGSPPAPTYADFQTGKQVDVKPSHDFAPYAEQIHKYPYLAYSWNLPSTIPDDLLLPFGDFVNKYRLQSLAYTIFSAGNGFTNILRQLTVNVMKMVDDSYINSNTVPGAAVIPTSGDNSEIYTKASAELGQDVLFSSTVTTSRRTAEKSAGISLVVKTPSGRKLIRASKLLITCPPTADNLKVFGLDSTEAGLFSQWTYSSYYSMVINNTGLPSGSQFSNANASSNTFNVPNLPAPYQLDESRVPGLYTARYGSPVPRTEAQVKSDVTAIIERLRSNFNSTSNSTPEFVAFKDNSPFKLVVSSDALTQGFYRKLNDLQGNRNTWYTGAAFISHDASILWNFTRSVVLPGLVAN